MEDEQLTPEQTDLLMQMQSATARSNPRLQDAANPEVMGPEQEVDPTRNTETYDVQISGETFNSDYYTQIDKDWKEANQTIETPIVGDLLNPIANPAANVYRQFMYGGNIAMNVGKEIYRKATNGDADPSWNNDAVTQWLDKNAGSIDVEQRWRYYGTINPAEAEALRADSDAQVQAMKINSMRGGFENFMAGAVAGLIDIDTPLVLLSGGLSASAKAGINASRAGRLLAGTVSGAAMGAALGTIDYGVNPTSDPESIAMFAAMGAGFGLVGGSMGKYTDYADNMRNNTVEELGRRMDAGEVPERGMPERSMYVEPIPETPATAAPANDLPIGDGISALTTDVGPRPEKYKDNFEWYRAEPEVYASTVRNDQVKRALKSREVLRELPENVETLYHGTAQSTANIKVGPTRGLYLSASSDVAGNYAKADIKRGNGKAANVVPVQVDMRLIKSVPTKAVHAGMTAELEKAFKEGYAGVDFGTPADRVPGTLKVSRQRQIAIFDEEAIVRAPVQERAAQQQQTGEAAPTGPKPDSFDPEQVQEVADVFDPLTMTGGSSVGAKQAGQRVYDGVGRAGITNKESAQLYDDSLQWSRSSSALRDYEDPSNLGNASMDPVVDRAVRFKQAVDAIGAGTDFDTMMRSKLVTAQRFATMLLESASGIGRTQTNAAVMKDAYHRDLVKHIRPVQAAFKEWHHQEQGFKFFDWLATPTGTGAWKSKERFHEEIIKEQMARRFGGQGTTSPAAKKAAEAVEKFYTEEYGIGMGRQGQTPLGGYDQFVRKPGYVSQQWSGRKMAQAVEDAGKVGGSAGAKRKVKEFKKALHEEYVRLHGNMPILKPMAAAVVDRALASRRGFKHDLIGLLRGDEGEFIRAALKRNGVRDKEIDSVLDSIVGSRADKTRIGATQSRTDVDFRSVSSNGIRMMDMLETDMDFLMASRANKTSGLAALARMGIPDRVTYEKWKKAILDEQTARGNKINSNQRMDGNGGIVQRPQRTPGDVVDDFVDRDPEVTEELLDAIYGYFSGNRPNAGQYGDAVIQRIKKLTRLSLMNQLGLTSMAEHGAIAGTVGWRRWEQHITQDLKEAMGNPASPLNDELRHFAFFEGEESLFNGRLMYEMDKAQSGELMQKLDGVLNKGLEIQGYLSGYHAVVGMQQRVAISSLTARIYGAFNTGKDGLSAQRMRDLGLDDAFMKRTAQFAQFDPDTGALVKLNMDQWPWEDVQLYQQIMSRGVNQLVQKAMAGESNWAFSANGIAQLFMQFKSFPLLAVHKQFTRNMRMADLETMNTFFFGLVTAGAAYSARQVINGNTDNLTPEKIAKGALNYSNMLGWIPMFVDPVLNAAGADFDTSGYSSAGVGSVISLPASFGTMEKMVQLPFMPLKLGLAATGNYEVKNSDIRVIQSLPILGNAYGINALLNMAKEAPRRRSEEKPPVPAPVKAPAKPATKPEKKAPVADGDLDKAAALAISAGWSDGYKYVQDNLDNGKTIEQIIKALNE